jgi:hypothetical protein
MAKRDDAVSVSQPTALTGLEIPILAAILGSVSKSAADVSVKGTEAIIAHLRKEGPVAYRILASWKESGHYCLAIEFLNVTLHGAYVETIQIVKPEKDFSLAFSKARNPREGISMPRRYILPKALYLSRGRPTNRTLGSGRKYRTAPALVYAFVECPNCGRIPKPTGCLLVPLGSESPEHVHCHFCCERCGSSRALLHLEREILLRH